MVHMQSNIFPLIVFFLVEISQHPKDWKNVAPGTKVIFTVTANTNVGKLTYQWWWNGNKVPAGASGDTTDTLTINHVTKNMEGTYRCIVSNTARPVYRKKQSNIANLTVSECL